jgi:hypothetical protein
MSLTPEQIELREKSHRQHLQQQIDECAELTRKWGEKKRLELEEKLKTEQEFRLKKQPKGKKK